MRHAIILSTSVFVSVCAFDAAEAALCKLPNGQVLNVNRPCRTDKFEMPVAPPPAPPMPPVSMMAPPAPMPFQPPPASPMPGPMPFQPPPPQSMPTVPPAAQMGASTTCVVPSLGACNWPGAQIGSQCSCSDGTFSYVGFAQ